MIRKIYKSKSLKESIKSTDRAYVVVPCVVIATVLLIAGAITAFKPKPTPTPIPTSSSDEEGCDKKSEESEEPKQALNPEIPGFIAQNDSSLTEYYVSNVVDGDTIDVRRIGSNSIQRVRLIGVNTPESVHPSKPVECFALEASAFTTARLKGEYVALIIDDSQDKFDSYNRLLAYVYLDGKLFNYDLIYNGYAYEYTYNDVPYIFQKEFKQAQSYAEKNKKGLWNPMTCPQA